LFDLIRNEVIRLENKLVAKNIYIELSKTYKEYILNDTNRFSQAIGCSNKSLYVNFVEDMDYFEIEPLIFPNHIENKQKFKIYG
jgi:ribonuclease G